MEFLHSCPYAGQSGGAQKDVAIYANEKRLLGTDSIAFDLFHSLLGGSTLLDAALLLLFTCGGNRCLLLFRLFGRLDNRKTSQSRLKW